MGQQTPSFTMRESLEVLDEALRLIDSPEKWTTGTWKCEIYERDPNSYLPKTNPLGEKIPKRDKHGRKVFAYCIEGAVNQAVINKFGPIRAKALGALNPNAPLKVETEYMNEQLDAAGACERLSVNDITRELYADEWYELRDADRPAQYLNDYRENSDEDEHNFGYEEVINVLKTKRDRVAAALAAKFRTA